MERSPSVGPLPGEQPQLSGAREYELSNLATHSGVDLPSDYRDFLRWSNGWEGFHGEAYLQRSSTSEAIIANDSTFRELYPDVVAIGGDGGLETFAFDCRSSGAPRGLLAFDRVAGLDSAIYVADTFSEAMERLAVEPFPDRSGPKAVVGEATARVDVDAHRRDPESPDSFWTDAEAWTEE